MLYFHIPFCTTKCHYCDFHSVALASGGLEAMVGAMVGEVEGRAGEIATPLNSIYFGGGTPSLLGMDAVGELMGAAGAAFDVSGVEEITFEANPEQLTKHYLEGLIALGINRLSIGVQSFDDTRLAFMGRRHTAIRALDAVADARAAGFDNISIDLIFGFENLTSAQWRTEVERAIELGVEHISAYQLSIEPRTVFARRGVRCASDDVSAEQYELLCDMLRTAGYDHYEISNFARSGRCSQHNSGYWSGRPYVGIGAGAHSFDGQTTRSWNVANNGLYVQGAAREVERLTQNDVHNEFVMTRLRTSKGFSLAHYNARFQRALPSVTGLDLQGDRVSIAERNMLIADSIIAQLFI